MKTASYSTRPTLRIDLTQLRENYRALSDLAPSAKVAASVKADAYGLGAEAVGRALYGAGCRIFFVATAGEGKILREAIGPNGAIYVLNGPAPRDKGVLLGAKLKPVINSLEQAWFWADVSRETNEPPYTAIMIDTGMNRLGLSSDDVTTLSKEPGLWKALNPDWVMSHLACASTPDHPLNAEQLKRFKTQAAKLPPTPMSFCATSGIYLGKDYHFGLVRPGIGLYGGRATNTPEKEVTKPVVRLLAPILQVKNVSKGETIGYEGTFTAPRDMRIATVGAGYADGMPVALSNSGHAIIHDQSVPIVGRISMDLTVLDVTEVHLPVQVGGVVEFLGDQLAAQAQIAGTIDYELLIRLGQRLRRNYMRSDKETQTTTPEAQKREGQKRGGQKRGGQKRDDKPRSNSRPPLGRRPSGGKSKPQRRGPRPRS